MKFVLYTHSLQSDWNHGNAHFLRGLLRELEARGHDTLALEPEDGWSRGNLLSDRGHNALDRFAYDFPELKSRCYGPGFDHEAAIGDASVVIVHEWTDPDLVRRLGSLRHAGAPFTLLFHDTHHRGISDSNAIDALPLADYDAVLAFGETLREKYLKSGWGNRVFSWHEAADTRLFQPAQGVEKEADLVWVGNWGDGEREAELETFLMEPARAAGLSGSVHGVRYPDAALQRLEAAGLRYRGWLANADVPAVFARHRMTIHVPRRPYVRALRGIPTIRMFEALACGIPLVSAPWDDSEGLFRRGTDYLVASTGDEMAKHLRTLKDDPALAAELAENGLHTIRTRHTCAHRVDELMTILAACGACERRVPEGTLHREDNRSS